MRKISRKRKGVELPRTETEDQVVRLSVLIKPELHNALKEECERESRRNGFYVALAPVVSAALRFYLGLEDGPNGHRKQPSVSRGQRKKRQAA